MTLRPLGLEHFDPMAGLLRVLLIYMSCFRSSCAISAGVGPRDYKAPALVMDAKPDGDKESDFPTGSAFWDRRNFVVRANDHRL